jgi:uncharacterized membrane protein YbhN (UPF0104 family)
MAESIKELLAFLRGIFLLILATIFSLIAFIYNNDASFFAWYVLAILILTDIILGFVILINIRKLKDLEC